MSATLVRLFPRLAGGVLWRPFWTLGWLYLFGSTVIVEFKALWCKRKGTAVAEQLREGALQTNSGSLEFARKRRPRVLMLCGYPIFPPDHGGGVRIFNLARRVARYCDLYILIFIRADDDVIQRQALEPFARKVYFHHWQPRFNPDFLGLQPRSAQLFASEEVRQRLNEILSTEKIDILQLEYTEMGQYGLPQFPRVKVALTEHDITFRSRWRRRAAGFHRRYPGDRNFGHTFGDWMRQLRYEIRVTNRADQVYVMSRSDGDYLARYRPAGSCSVRVIANGVATDFYQPSEGIRPDRYKLLFLGNFQHLPNLDALEYFFNAIWDRIRVRVPEVEITIVGTNPTEQVTQYAKLDGVTVTGPVPEVKPYYQSHGLLVAPIRAGSGTRLKILEAMACGLPVVSTSMGAEGIECVAGQHLLIADDPEAFAQAIQNLLEDNDLWVRLSAEGRRLVEEKYDWDLSANKLLAAYHEMLADSGELEACVGKDAAGVGDVNSEAPEKSVEISVIIPTLNGGESLRRCLEAIFSQEIMRAFEVICIDSSSDEDNVKIMQTFPIRRVTIGRKEFNHGLTRDQGAELSLGRVLVYLNQDAIPCDRHWLRKLTEPLFAKDSYHAAVQGAIQELPGWNERFFWDSCGERFYFTRESKDWIQSFFGIGFSTVNAAIRREVWERHHFGYAPIMEDKKWQSKIVQAGHSIVEAPKAVVFHTHKYNMRSLLRRCESEGFGWRTLGVGYSFLDMLRDMGQRSVYVELYRGLVQNRITSAAELFFPWLRPLALYYGNRFSRGVRL